MSNMSAAATITLRYQLPAAPDDWALSEEPVPESQPHDQTIELLRAILLHWIAREHRDAQVARNLALRWVQRRPQIGVDPDLCVIEPATPEGDELESLCTWEPGHTPPMLAIEIVSSKAKKDYAIAPEKYAASGTRELWIFDAKLRGPKAHGGPHRLQIWRRERDAFERVYAGEGPAFSPAMNAWLFVVDEGRRLRIARDREGTQWWPTREEAALARIAELEAMLERG
jgi:Uma2 family endonuclease